MGLSFADMMAEEVIYIILQLAPTIVEMESENVSYMNVFPHCRAMGYQGATYSSIPTMKREKNSGKKPVGLIMMASR